VQLQNRLIEAEKQTRLVVAGLSVLRQLGEHLALSATPALFDELVALARAQRRALMAAHSQLEADPLLAHLLKSRVTYHRADEHRTKSGKPMEDLVRSTYFVAQGHQFRGDIDEWRKLLAIFPTRCSPIDLYATQTPPTATFWKRCGEATVEGG